MSHNLEIQLDGTVCFAYAGETPWHSLGKRVPADLTPTQMLKAAHLNWKVQKYPLYFERDGEQILSDRMALVRESDGSVLDYVTQPWNPLQNKEAFEFFNEFVAAGDMEMHTAGSLQNGRIVWALAKVNESFEVFGNDRVDSYLLFTNPHKFGMSISVDFTPIRVVCNNTLAMALRRQSQRMVRILHHQEFDPEVVKEALGVAKSKLNEYKERAEFLGSKRYTEESLTEYFQRIFPVAKANKLPEDKLTRKRPTGRASETGISLNAKKALAIVEQQPGHQFAEGSYWQAFNAATFLIDHHIGRTADTRLTSAWYGPNRDLKLTALKTAVEMAKEAA